jgi:hypothetical protein
MPNEIIGRIFKFAGETTGQGANGPWVKSTVILETTTDRYPKKVALLFWTDKANEVKTYQVGDEVRVAFDVESREYNDRWYTDLRAWKIERLGATATPGASYAQPQAQPAAASAYAQPASNGADSFNPSLAPADDDLPF